MSALRQLGRVCARRSATSSASASATATPLTVLSTTVSRRSIHTRPTSVTSTTLSSSSSSSSSSCTRRQFIRQMSTAATSSSSSPSSSTSQSQQCIFPPPQSPSLTSSTRPSNVGIHAIDMYFPKQYVSQTDLETYNGVSHGKYTIGLGQHKMAFVTDREDIYSVCLSAVARFMEQNQIPYNWIGRLEVASETIQDHSKAIKTHLMQLFEASGNTDIEGIDSMNACYAGTNALFNSTAWVESSAWDGRYSLVVSADIAEYAQGVARPTGGCGAVVMLIGPDAPIVMERPRATHMENAWDFYKPHLISPYPVVDGKFSNSCYLRSLDVCYQRYVKKFEALSQKTFSVINDTTYVLFHAPYNKLVQKSFGRLIYNESKLHPDAQNGFDLLVPFHDETDEKSYDDPALDKVAVAVSKFWYGSKVGPSCYIPQQLGNMYTASLYAGLMSTIHNEKEKLEGKRILMFSYGSGLAASMFSLQVRSGTDVVDRLNYIVSQADIENRLNARVAIDPKTFNEWMSVREKLHVVDGPFVLEGKTDQSQLFQGAFYLQERDADGKRRYQRVQ